MDPSTYPLNVEASPEAATITMIMVIATAIQALPIVAVAVIIATIITEIVTAIE